MIVEQVAIGAPQPLAERMPFEPLKAQHRMRYEATDESKYILIAGGGKVGVNLARELYESGHEVAVIEQNPPPAGVLSGKPDLHLYLGDKSTHDLLHNAGAPRARVFLGGP